MRSIKGQEEYVGQSNAYISIYKRRLQAASLSSYAPFPTTMVCAIVHTFVQAVYSAQTPICQLYVSWHPFAWATCATWDSHLFAYSLLFFDSLIRLLLMI